MLRVHDARYAANQLLNMAFGHFNLQLQFGLIQQVPEAELDAHLRRVVEDFWVLYGEVGGWRPRRQGRRMFADETNYASKPQLPPKSNRRAEDAFH